MNVKNWKVLLALCSLLLQLSLLSTVVEAKTTGGADGGGGNLMSNGQTVDQYLYEHTISTELLLKLAEFDLKNIRDRFPGFESFLKETLETRTWYNVDVPLKELSLNATKIPFETTQGAYQDEKVVIFSKLYSGSDITKIKYTADIIIHELIKAALWNRDGRDNPQAVFSLSGPFLAVPMASNQKIKEAFLKNELNFLGSDEIKQIQKIVAFNKELHSDYQQVLPKMLGVCADFGADMTKAGFQRGIDAILRNYLEDQSKGSSPSRMIEFKNDSDAKLMTEQIRNLMKSIKEKTAKLDNLSSEIEWDNICKATDKDFYEVYSLSGSHQYSGMKATREYKASALGEEETLSFLFDVSVAFPAPGSIASNICSENSKNAISNQYERDFPELFFLENALTTTTGDRGICSLVYILNQAIER